MERAPKTLVVDASVVAKWFIPEEDSDKAIRLRNRHIEGSLTLMAPDLIVYEVANALAYHPDVADEDLREDVEALFMIDLDLVFPSTELMASIAEGARRHAISVYDSSYLALAEFTATNLVTADRRLYEKVEEKGRVLMLDELDRSWSI
jgi:predicted nucleic acid-binding protein